jgi:hypothetical protein
MSNRFQSPGILFSNFLFQDLSPVPPHLLNTLHLAKHLNCHSMRRSILLIGLFF